MAGSQKASWSVDRTPRSASLSPGHSPRQAAALSANRSPRSASSPPGHSPPNTSARSASSAAGHNASAPVARTTLSVAEYYSKQQLKQARVAMSAPKSSADAPKPRIRRANETLFEGLEEGEEVDYGSDTCLREEEEDPPRGRTTDKRDLRTPNPFVERSDAVSALTALRTTSSLPSRDEDEPMEANVVSNNLDEVQSQQLAAMEEAPRAQRPIARPLLHPSRRDYGFEPRDPNEVARLAASQLLNDYVIGPAAHSNEEVAQREDLRQRLLTPQLTTQREYRERLQLQARGASVPQMRTYPVVLLAGERQEQDVAQFELWVEGARKLSSIVALQASFKKDDVLLERRLRFAFAKLKAKRQLPSGFQPRPAQAPQHAPPSSADLPQGGSSAAAAQGQSLSSAVDPLAPRPTAGKRVATDAPVASPQGAVDRFDQKRPRRQDSLAGGVPQTPMSSASGGTLATSPDTGIDFGGDAEPQSVPHGSGDCPAHRATPVADAELHWVHRSELEDAWNAMGSLRREVVRLRETLHQAENAYDRSWHEIDQLRERVEWFEAPAALANRVSDLERGLARLEGQVDLLLRLQQGSVAVPPVHAPVPAPPRSPAPGPGTA
ncbi:hypothetical protein PRIC2_000723 [Phytophthora ramorum]